MLNTLSLATAVEKAKIDGSSAFLIALDIEVIDPVTAATVETLRFVRNNEPIVVGGFTYVPSVFDITFGVETGSQPRVNLTVTEVTGALQAYMESHGGGVGFVVTMTIVNSALLVPEIVEQFQILSASCAEWTASFALGAENETMTIYPARRQTRDFCQWRFKGHQCAYVGPLSTCDLTLLGPNGCKVHGNTLNFGGFPGISGNGFSYG